MFEVAELGHKVAKKEYHERVPALRTELLVAQQALRKADFPVLILVSGADGAGKGSTVNLINEWLDPRYVRTYAFGPPTDEERERPPYWRYWSALPAKGRIGLYVGSWYSDPIAHRVRSDYTDAEFDTALARINAFEKTLVDDGALIIKFWLHLSKREQKKRLQRLEEDPETRWRVSKQDWEQLKIYDRFVHIAEHTLRATSTGEASWTIVEGSDARYRNLTVGQCILDRINHRLTENIQRDPPQPHLLPIAAPAPGTEPVSVLQAVDLKKTLGKDAYKTQLKTLQSRLGKLSRKALTKKVSSMVMLEGWDAAGKGGLIRRMTAAMDARVYQVIPVAAPTDEETAHHYLWRFWRHIPRAGHVTIYDRSWYGRVLVERIEGYTHQQDWMRAYTEICDFEEQLTRHGIVIVKFWVHIDREEQLARFKAREQTPHKQHKITEEDYRNREKWKAYEHAVNDMIERTSTDYAPWTIIAGNDKKYARVQALEVFCDRLEKAL
ncbi:MAG: polyphosphate:AMP phosphotransferase [Proteobacteria bacterium]|nr:MAG: polyphosphate:AMP phosphotransferase [Pseudomonadota bacterium]QKK11064.1 MAG: polyphosphate:AMP phosphotransferase [Pseudomonadota bacterium]